MTESENRDRSESASRKICSAFQAHAGPIHAVGSGPAQAVRVFRRSSRESVTSTNRSGTFSALIQKPIATAVMIGMPAMLTTICFQIPRVILHQDPVHAKGQEYTEAENSEANAGRTGRAGATSWR